jgi:K+-transporting ATPase ATPase B chain
VAFHPRGAAAIMRRNILIYAVGGIIAPFLGIKAIDLVLSVLRVR